MLRPILLLLALSSCTTPTVADAISAPTRKSLWAERGDDSLTIRFADDLVAEYWFRGAEVPYLYPLLGPDGIPVTRGYPMEERPGEARDHPHHRSAWFAHGDVDGVDFWHPQGENGGTIEYTGKLTEILTRGKTLRTRLSFQWKDKEGDVLLDERRTVHFGYEPSLRFVDFVFELTAAKDEVVFGDTKEGTFALRLHPALRLEGEVANGRALNAEGVQGKDVWGKRSKWVSYQGTIDDEPIAVTIYDHPENLRHPTWWHARAYGLFAANPFGQHDFEGVEGNPGRHVLKKGETLVLQYRVWIQRGVQSAEELDKGFDIYVEHAKHF